MMTMQLVGLAVHTLVLSSPPGVHSPLRTRHRCAVACVEDSPSSPLPSSAEDASDVPPPPPSGQSKPKVMTDRFDLEFTCNKCETRNRHSISRLAYQQGMVLVTCPGCEVRHIIADNLNWLEDDFSTIEEHMAKRGMPVTRVQRTDVEYAPRETPAQAEAKEPPQPVDEQPISTIEGITQEQALRIREAVRANRRRKRAQAIQDAAAAASSAVNAADDDDASAGA